MFSATLSVSDRFSCLRTDRHLVEKPGAQDCERHRRRLKQHKYYHALHSFNSLQLNQGSNNYYYYHLMLHSSHTERINLYAIANDKLHEPQDSQGRPGASNV